MDILLSIAMILLSVYSINVQFPNEQSINAWITVIIGFGTGLAFIIFEKFVIWWRGIK